VNAIVLALLVAGAYPAGECRTWAEIVREIAALPPIEQARIPQSARIMHEMGRLTDWRYAILLRALAFVRESPAAAYERAIESCPQDVQV